MLVDSFSVHVKNQTIHSVEDTDENMIFFGNIFCPPGLRMLTVIECAFHLVFVF